MGEIERPSANSARAVRAYDVPPEALLVAVLGVIERLSRWEVASRNEREVTAVRTTRFFRFKDDVTVVVEAAQSGSQAEFTSASRVGKGDLGQNPRNLEELFDGLNREIQARS